MYKPKNSYKVNIPLICDKDTEEAKLAKELYHDCIVAGDLRNKTKIIRQRLAALIEEAGEPINSIQTPEFRVVWCDVANSALSGEDWEVLDNEFPDASEWLRSRGTRRYLSVSPITK